MVVSFSPDTDWTAVRSFQVMDKLGSIGRVIVSEPSKEDIEQARVGHHLSVIIAGGNTEGELRDAVESVEDVHSVEISPYVMETAPVASELVLAGVEAASTSSKGMQPPQTVRIDVERLDQLMNMVGELVIDRTRIIQISKSLASRFGDDDMVEALGKTSEHIVRVVDEIQDSTASVRMLPIGTVFSGLPRMLRDLAQTAGKKVDFTVDGQDTEIDRTVTERIRDPLVHLLRNAVDHGVETPEQRTKAGKPETAEVRLSAFHSEGYIVITVQDDGRGISPDRVRESALKKGLITREAASRLSDSELSDLIFMPGMSTAEKTTEVSGRGVGMDIVKANIEAINGFVSVESKPGEGAEFTLKLPLTLATVQALLVSCVDTLYAVPVVHIIESAKLEPEEIQTIGGKEVFRLRGEVVPLLRLATALNTRLNGAGHLERTFVVVLQLGERLVGLGVDALIELQEIVVKSMGTYTGDLDGVAGASILGDGQVVLILDVPTLVNAAIFDRS